MTLESIRKNWNILTLIAFMIYGWASIQMDITQIKKDVINTIAELDFTKSQYYSVENKIIELQVEVRNLQKNSDMILEEVKSIRK